MYKWLLLVLFPIIGNSQETFKAATKIKAAALPAGLKFRGKLNEIWQWQDKLGNNLLITSVLGPYAAKGGQTDDTKTIELFAVHYVKKDTGYKALWRLNDIVKECELDLTCEFIRNSTTITDLDQDSIAETKVQYKTGCRGDVSPSYMKLIMHEDTMKYALRGNMWIAGAGGDTVFKVTERNVNLEKLASPKAEMAPYEQTLGRYETEKDFRKAPATFLPFARHEWVKYAKESFDE